MKKKIYHIQTGGTIGGCIPEYKEIGALSNLFFDINDLAKFATGSMKLDADYETYVLCHKDSRQLTNGDRMYCVERIREQFTAGARLFLITHGTYTMKETALFLEQHLPAEVLSQVNVVLTGSMYPWNLLGSDAPMNLGGAFVSLLNANWQGVRICMHGQNYIASEIVKDADKLIYRKHEEL